MKGLGILWLLALAVFSPTVSYAQTSAPTADQVARYFDDIVFGGRFAPRNGNKSIKKWTKPVINISLQGRMTTDHAKWLEAHLNAITKVSGLRFAQVNPSTKGEDISFIFLKRNEMSHIKGKGINQGMVNALASEGGCYFMAFSNAQDVFSRAIIVVNVERPDQHVQSCLLEETVQTLGLPYDSDNLRPSIFSDSDHITSMSYADAILLRTLYDPRIPIGLNRESAKQRAKLIIAEQMVQ